MSIRKKTVLIISTTILSLVALLYTAAQIILQTQVVEEEKRAVRQSMELAQKALANSLADGSCLVGLRVNEAGDQEPHGAIFEQKVGLLRQDLAPPPLQGPPAAVFSGLGQTGTGRLEG